MSDPTQGDTAYIVDEQGATFAFTTAELAARFAADEREAGSVDVTEFTVTVPADDMTWADVAEYALRAAVTMEDARLHRCSICLSDLTPAMVGQGSASRLDWLCETCDAEALATANRGETP